MGALKEGTAKEKWWTLGEQGVVRVCGEAEAGWALGPLTGVSCRSVPWVEQGVSRQCVGSPSLCFQKHGNPVALNRGLHSEGSISRGEGDLCWHLCSAGLPQADRCCRNWGCGMGGAELLAVGVEREREKGGDPGLREGRGP